VIALAALPFVPNPPALALQGSLAFLSESEIRIVNKPKPPQGGFFMVADIAADIQ